MPKTNNKNDVEKRINLLSIEPIFTILKWINAIVLVACLVFINVWRITGIPVEWALFLGFYYYIYNFWFLYIPLIIVFFIKEDEKRKKK